MNNPNPFENISGIQQDANFANDTFEHINSHGANPEKLARLLSVFKLVRKALGQDENLLDVITGYQASIDAKYHNDFVKIAELQHYVNTLKKSRSGSPNGFYSAQQNDNPNEQK